MALVQPAPQHPDASKSATTWWVCALLVVAIAAAYWPVAGNAFIYFDDVYYVSENPHVLTGLTWSNMAWAFTHFYVSNWHPVTWLSHMLDMQLFGMNAGGHHVTSVLFHAANTVLLFLWLKKLTGLLWRSALVAALFGLHPLHVESVAWIAERKDVLSTFFFLLALMAYTRYVRKPKMCDPISDSQSPSSGFGSSSSNYYLLSLFCFALGLMSKPMVVTLPFVLLLLDFWPLGRMSTFNFQSSTFKHLLFEKAPFFVLSAASCGITFIAQRNGGSVMFFKILPVEARLQNTVVSYVQYLEKMFWPESLAAYYPLSYPIADGEVAMATFVLLLVTGTVALFWRQRPYLAMGWFWFLGMLVPVIGLVQVGSQSRADRYTYLPLIGLFIALVWLVAEIKSEWKHRTQFFTILSAVVLAACWLLTTVQVRYWRNSETLARHALAVTNENPPMEVLLGNALLEQGKPKEASQHFATALKTWPSCVPAMGGLALALAGQRRLDEAIDICHAALTIKPNATQIHCLLGGIFSRQGKLAEAISEHRIALQIDPDHLDDLNNLAWLLATAPDSHLRNGVEAVPLAEKACRLTNYKIPLILGTLAATYAEAGRFDDAAATAQKAITLAATAKQEGLVQKNRELLELYQNKKAYHEPPIH